MLWAVREDPADWGTCATQSQLWFCECHRPCRAVREVAAGTELRAGSDALVPGLCPLRPWGFGGKGSQQWGRMPSRILWHFEDHNNLLHYSAVKCNDRTVRWGNTPIQSQERDLVYSPLASHMFCGPCPHVGSGQQEKPHQLPVRFTSFWGQWRQAVWQFTEHRELILRRQHRDCCSKWSQGPYGKSTFPSASVFSTLWLWCLESQKSIQKAKTQKVGQEVILWVFMDLLN